MRSTRYAIYLASGYAVVSAIYILLSGRIARHMAVNVEQLARIEASKGVVFVVVTALGVFLGARFLLGRIEHADQLLHRREMALLANERRVFAGLMAASTAHDANNVLQGVIMDLDALRRTIGSDDPKLQRIQVAFDRLVALNRRLSGTVRHGRSSQAEPLDLAATVQDAVKLAASHDHLRGVRVRFESPGVVPARTHPLLVHQIVSNLVVNAGEATAGKGHVEVRLSPRLDGATLEVHDDGPGVPAERRLQLFEALETTKSDGSGLGLFSVKSCAVALGGSVEVGDSPLGGACFRVALPLGLHG